MTSGDTGRSGARIPTAARPYDSSMDLEQLALDPAAGIGHRLDSEPPDRLSALADAATTAGRNLLASTDIEDRVDAAIAYRTLSAVTASGIRHNNFKLAEEGIAGLLSLYRLGDYDVGRGLDTPDFEASLWESIWIEVLALGGLVVHLRAWDYLELIAMQSPAADDTHYVSWHRHGQVHSARATRGVPDESVLTVADKRLGSMHSETAASARQLVARFDLLAGLLIGGVDSRATYPNAAAFSEELVEPFVIESMRDAGDPLRAVLFPNDDLGLREQLRLYNESAVTQAALMRYSGQPWGWRGFEDARTWMFVRDGIRLEELRGQVI